MFFAFMWCILIFGFSVLFVVSLLSSALLLFYVKGFENPVWCCVVIWNRCGHTLGCLPSSCSRWLSVVNGFRHFPLCICLQKIPQPFHTQLKKEGASYYGMDDCMCEHVTDPDFVLTGLCPWIQTTGWKPTTGNPDKLKPLVFPPQQSVVVFVFYRLGFNNCGSISFFFFLLVLAFIVQSRLSVLRLIQGIWGPVSMLYNNFGDCKTSVYMWLESWNIPVTHLPLWSKAGLFQYTLACIWTLCIKSNFIY